MDKLRVLPLLRQLTGWILLILTLLAVALVFGSAILLLTALLIAALAVHGYASVLWAARRLQLALRCSPEAVPRGSEIRLTVSSDCPRPLLPGHVYLCLRLDGGPARTLTLRMGHGSGGAVWTVPHSGVFRPRITGATLQDISGLFECSLSGEIRGPELYGLPKTFPVPELREAEPRRDMGTMAAAAEDVTDPADIRAYQPGDPMKRLHWKLSLRRMEPLVRRFEGPASPGLLILLDPAMPPEAPDARWTADCRDFMLDTAASVIGQMLRLERRFTLCIGSHPPRRLTERDGSALLLRALALAAEAPAGDFARLLEEESSQARQAGAAVVITACPSEALFSRLVALRRAGPNLRLYASPPPGGERLSWPLLQQEGIEVLLGRWTQDS